MNPFAPVVWRTFHSMEWNGNGIESILILIMTEWTAGHIYIKSCQKFDVIGNNFSTQFLLSVATHHNFYNKEIPSQFLKRCRITLYMRKISFIWSRLMVPLPNLSYSYKKKTPHFYRTQVRSLHCLPL